MGFETENSQQTKKIKITTEYITLGAFLKFVGVVERGSDEKNYLLSNPTSVNGENETRRGRKLYPGFKITTAESKFEIVK